MSQPKRYFFIGDLLPGQTRYPHHHFVLYDDYAALAAENERLRKAGDEMAKLMQAEENEAWKYCGTGGKPPLRLCVKKWNAAKQGRDAK